MIERDDATSVPNRNLELEEKLHKLLYDKYLKTFTDQLDRLEKVDDFVRDDTYHGISSGHHRAYKLKVGPGGETYLESPDGLRRYEFLIEFDFDDASYGIYYGCRGLIMGGEQEEQIDLFAQEWKELSNEMCQVLNNTFTDLDFSGRFQLTNNANNKTYWLFWIALYAGEDILDVAVRATRLIAKVFIHAQRSSDGPVTSKEVKKEVKKTETRFTNENFKSIIHEIEDNTRHSGDKQSSLDDKVKAFERFFSSCETINIIDRDDRYEKAWRLREGISNVKLAALIKCYCEKYRLKNNGVPWTRFQDLILSPKGTLLGSLKQSISQAKDDSDSWAKNMIEKMDP